MIKIGITGSLASGKSTASKFLSYKRGPLFSADKAVRDIYNNSQFRSLISKKFNIINNAQLKKSLKKKNIRKKRKYYKIREVNSSFSKKKNESIYL